MSPFDPETGQPDGWPPKLVPGPAWQAPPVYTARQVSDLELPWTKPILTSEERGPLLAPGWRMVVGGQTGAGKTVLQLRMVRAIVLKEDFLVWTGQGGRALMIDLEQGLRTVQRRLEECGLTECDEIDYVRIPDGVALNEDADVQDWLSELLADNLYTVVCVDPLYKLHRADPNDEREMVKLMSIIDRWRERDGFALILPAHLRKASTIGRSKPSMDDISGAGAIVRGAEVVIGLQLVSGLGDSGEGVGKSRLYWWKDRDGDLPVGTNWPLNFTPRGGFSRDTSERRISTTEVVLALLSEAWPSGLTAEEMADSTGKVAKTIRRCISDLKKSGYEIDHQPMPPHGLVVYKLTEVYDGGVEEWEK